MPSDHTQVSRTGLSKFFVAPALQRIRRFKRWQLLMLLFALLVIATLFIALIDIDRKISSLLYSPENGWFLKRHPFWEWLHHYGTIPGIIFSIGALLTWLMSYYFSSLKQWRKPCLVVVLTSVLAAGLIVNAVLKQYWGRPRPSQTIEYGGKWEYRSIYNPGPPGKGASFPCGHATMGFVFLAAGSFYYRSRIVAVTGVSTGIVLGGLLSAGRIVQGAHYLSDTIWSLGIIVIVALGLVFFLPETKDKKTSSVLTEKEKGQRTIITAITIVAVLLMAAGFLTRRPYYKTRDYPLQLSGVETIHISTKEEPERVALLYSSTSNSNFRVDAHGFGWIEAEYKQNMKQDKRNKDLYIDLNFTKESYFAELDHSLTLTLPKEKKNQIDIVLNKEPLY